MSDPVMMKEIEAAARTLNVEPAALAAVARLESGLRAHAVVNGRPEPLIRFEGHYFDRRLSGAKREEARRQGLSSPKAGAIANPASQAARWALLDRAAKIDRAAACESVSWGLGQVMGAHWKWLGYRNIDALVKDARSGPAGQLQLMVRYIEKAGLAEALRAHDWARFARGYNGPGYRANHYDTRLAGAYGLLAGTTARGATIIRRGAQGEDVRALQTALADSGFQLAVDGVFGPATEAAVKRFQAARGLVVDGIAGPATRKALESTPRKPSLLDWLYGFLQRLAST